MTITSPKMGLDLIYLIKPSKAAPEEMKEYLSTVQEFTTLDLNGDGKVTLSEMKKYVKYFRIFN